MAEQNVIDVVSAVEDNVEALSEQLGFDAEDKRYAELAKQNGLLEKKGDADPVKPDEVRGKEADPAGKPTEATPPSGAESTEKSGDWRTAAENDRWPKGFRKELTRKERQIESLTEKYEQMQRQLQQFSSQGQGQASQTLSRSQFASDEAYIEARVQQTLYEVQSKQAEENQKLMTAQQAQQAATQEWASKVDRLYKTPEEKAQYMEALEDLGPLNKVLDERTRAYIFKSRVGPMMLHFLRNRPDVIEELPTLHDADLYRTLQAVAQEVSSPASAGTAAPAAPAPAARVSKAQAVGTLGAKGNGSDGGELTQAQMTAYYRKHGHMPGE